MSNEAAAAENISPWMRVERTWRDRFEKWFTSRAMRHSVEMRINWGACFCVKVWCIICVCWFRQTWCGTKLVCVFVVMWDRDEACCTYITVACCDIQQWQECEVEIAADFCHPLFIVWGKSSLPPSPPRFFCSLSYCVYVKKCMWTWICKEKVVNCLSITIFFLHNWSD